MKTEYKFAAIAAIVGIGAFMYMNGKKKTATPIRRNPGYTNNPYSAQQAQDSFGIGQLLNGIFKNVSGTLGQAGNPGMMGPPAPVDAPDGLAINPPSNFDPYAFEIGMYV